MNTVENEFLTPKEVMALLRISRSTLDNWVRTGQLKAYKAGKKLVRFRRDEVLEMLSEQGGQSGQPKKPKERVTHFGAFSHLNISSEHIIEDREKEIEEGEREWKERQIKRREIA